MFQISCIGVYRCGNMLLLKHPKELPHLVKKTPIRSGVMDKTQAKLPQSGIFQ